VTFVAPSRTAEQSRGIRGALEAPRTVGRAMTTEVAVHVDGAVLVAEVQRYLAAVELFRAEGREPNWLPDPGSPLAAPSGRRRRGVTNARGGMA
jgi:hypothetical protein